MVSFEDIPEAYFTQNLLSRDDPKKVWIKENQVTTICFSIALLSAIYCATNIYLNYERPVPQVDRVTIFRDEKRRIELTIGESRVYIPGDESGEESKNNTKEESGTDRIEKK